ncbi:MAG TPA: serine hydrolase [Arenimonas sp.]|nr:serine hydrolase [Arenimonas sp.]HPO24605.1 serine hydrolase [Arenimonas sp.]HPW33071.1 serine hydrolase [Arenimonas sp.]
MKYSKHILGVAIALASVQAAAMTDGELKSITEQRLLGDRTGACFAVAVIEETVSRAYVCADPNDLNRISPKTAFEIGSVTKTMTSALLADLILQGKASLEDPITAYLPKGTVVPDFEGKPILIKHLVTHTSGLPVVPDFGSVPNMENPYAKVDEASLMKTLASAKLQRAPGSQFEYSNYAMMLLTSMIAKRANTDFESLLRAKLFSPTGMGTAYINQKPDGIKAAQGHTPNGKSTPAWTFQTNAAGVGGVRATLDDMVNYVQAELGKTQSAISPALKLTQEQIKTDANNKMAMNWMLAPLDAHQVHVHEGGTGGFSAFTLFDLEKQRGVVILSDTALTSVGGLGSLGNHLLDKRLPLGKARKAKQPDAELLKALVGEYDFVPGMKMTLTSKDGRLYSQATGQAVYEMAYDSAGDFYPLEFDATIRTQKKSDGSYALLFLQSGAAFPLKKVEAGSTAKPSLQKPSAEQLQSYAGVYGLGPNFDLKVFVEKGGLMAQATGQGAFEIEQTAKDQFAAEAYGIEIHFERDGAGNVQSLKLLQAGHVTPAKKK